MATVTFTVPAPQQPKYRINSVHEVMQRIASTATWSAGEVYIFNNLKIPDRAIVTGLQVWGSVPDGTYLIEIGTYGSAGTADIFGSVTLSATAATNSVRTVGLPYTVSCSDDATLRYQTLGIRVDGAATSGTTSVSVNMLVKYIMR
jgi:hypothetical protein